MRYIYRITNYFSSYVHAPQSLRLFSILVYLWFLINACMTWSVRDLLWGPKTVFYRQGHADGIIENFIYRLVYDTSEFHVIFYVHLICALLSLFEKKWSFIPRIGTWLTGLMLYYAAVEAFNSAMLLMLLMAFYCSVVYVKDASSYRNVLTNAARIACIIQVMIVYAVATIYKLGGEQWLSGTAVYYLMHIDHYTVRSIQDSVLLKTSWIMKALTYFALAYQLLFPFIIWFKKSRLWFLLVGLLFHLFIGFVMHLWDFALAMIFCYALFLPERMSGNIMLKKNSLDY